MGRIYSCIFAFFACTIFVQLNCFGLTDDLDTALQKTYISCVSIDEELADLKKKAGINTAITGVGTAVGIGATVTGLVKKKVDVNIEQLERELEKIREKEQNGEYPDPTEEELSAFIKSTPNENTSSETTESEEAKIQSEIDRLDKKSKKLGNWRTGLLAGNTATNVAGAVIAGTNKVKGDLKQQIDDCITAVQNLRKSIAQAKIEKNDTREANQILNACIKYETVDISKINNRATGAMVSSTVGAVTGVAGTLSSVFANTKKTRDDNSEAGKLKEKKLNAAANILAGASTLASGSATVFNATQIKAIKDVATVAAECTGALK